MSTSTEITRLQTARDEIRAKLVSMGLAQSTDTLDVLANAMGSIEDRGAVSALIMEGDTYAIPKGYHNGSGTVSAIAGGGNYNLQSKTVIPTKSQQNVTPDDGYFGLSDVTVSAIPESYADVSGVTVKAADVLSGKTFVDDSGVLAAGSMPNNGAVDITLPTQDDKTTFTIPAGYHNGEGMVKIVPEEKTVTPTESEQSVLPSPGKVLGSVTVERIPTNYYDTSESTVAAGDILSGKTAFGSAGAVTGTMPNNGPISATIDGLSITSYAVPAGYTSGGTVSLTSAIEEALAAI